METRVQDDRDFGSWHARRPLAAVVTPTTTPTDSPQQSLLRHGAAAPAARAGGPRREGYEACADGQLVSSPSGDSFTAPRGYSLKQEDFLPAGKPAAASPTPASPPRGHVGMAPSPVVGHPPQGATCPLENRDAMSLTFHTHNRPVKRTQHGHGHHKKASHREHIPLVAAAGSSSFGDQIRASPLPASPPGDDAGGRASPREASPGEETPPEDGVTPALLTPEQPTPTSRTSLDGNPSNRCVTMTGTIKRGQKLRDTVEVQLQMTQDELNRMQRSFTVAAEEKKGGKCGCGARVGLHVLIFSILFWPLGLLVSLCMSFYVGTMCWYNLYLYLSEEKTVWHRIFLCPLLILFYPVLIVLSAFCIAIYAAFVQISWFFSSWLKEVRDFDKGFYGWLCNKLHVPECSPYEIVILNEGQGQTIAMPQSLEEGSPKAAV